MYKKVLAKIKHLSDFYQFKIIRTVEKYRYPEGRIATRYISTTLKRIDAFIHYMKGVKNIEWYDGILIQRHPKGHGSELNTFIPDCVWRKAHYLKCNLPITSLILDL